MSVKGRAIVAQSGGPTAVISASAAGVIQTALKNSGTGISQAFRDYALPLIRGEAPIDIAPDGLPLYAHLNRQLLARKTVERRA